MAKTNSKATSDDAVRSSVSSIYSALLSKRATEKQYKEEQKRMQKELEAQEKADKKENGEKEEKLTKKEKRQKEFDNWKEIVIGLTGDDLEYSDKKKSKKKYRKWIDDDDINAALNQKQKKIKKKNYHKEFEPELNMLRTLVSEQNRFTADLQKRFQNAAGPANKDAQLPNKTLVELASVIASGRSNSLGMLREIGSLKKTMAELYMKQKKLDADLAGSSGSFDSTDMSLLGSNIASSLFSSPMTPSVSDFGTPVNINTPSESEYSQTPNYANLPAEANVPPVAPQIQAFDPNSWDGPELNNDFTKYENIPHTVVVQKRSDGAMRFAAIRDDNGEELVGCNVPTTDPTKLQFNETDMTVKGDFDEVYKVVEV